jgi:serine protease Do
MFCTLWNREEIEAELIGTDAMTDISVIKLKPDSPREFEPVGFGDSTKMRVGDPVLAMGSPMALSQSVTLGIISNIEMIMPRFFGQSRFRLDGEDVGSLVKWIGHDAPIYGGNSGGPLVNLKGEIIGINEISFGLGGAIPGNLAKQVAETLKANGKIERSWLGVDVQPVFKRAKNKRGVLISGVMDESPADTAGLKSGESITMTRELSRRRFRQISTASTAICTWIVAARGLISDSRFQTNRRSCSATKINSNKATKRRCNSARWEHCRLTIPTRT